MRTAISRLPKYHIVVYSFYLLMNLIITWPLVTDIAGQFIGGSTSDAYEMARNTWWFTQALRTGQPIFYQTTLGYPEGFSGVALWAHPLQHFPAWLLAFIMPLAAAHNLTILLMSALNGWAAYLLAQDRFKGHRIAALVTGLVFMSFPALQGHMFEGHVGPNILWALPLYIYALFRLTETGAARWRWLAILFFFLTTGGHPLQIIYLLLPVTALFLLAQVGRGRWNAAGQVAIVGVIGAIICGLFLMPVLGDTLSTPAYTEAGGYVRYSLDLLAVASPSFLHPVLGELFPYARQVLGVNLGEGLAYVGIVVGLLSIVGLITQRDARWWLLLGLVGWVLALGPVLKLYDQPLVMNIDGYESVVAMPWAGIYELPLFSLARTPARFAYGLALAVAMLAGYGITALAPYQPGQRTSRMQAMATVLIMTVIVWEYQSFWPMPTQTAQVPEAITDMRDDDTIRAVFNLPWDDVLAAKDALFLQTIHQKPLIAGQVTRQTPVDPAMLNLLQNTLDLALLNEAEVDRIILHRSRAAARNELEGLQEQIAQQLGQPDYVDDQIAVYSVPSTREAPSYTDYASPQRDVTAAYTAQFYAAEPGWIDLRARVGADDRSMWVYLDETPLQSWQVDGVTSLEMVLPVGSRGYHQITLALDPACPRILNPTLNCRTLDVLDLDLVPVTEGPLYDPVRFAEGVELAASHLTPIEDDSLPVRLWWRFTEPRSASDIRFVHLVGQDGQLYAQDDRSLGPRSADSEWAELVRLPTAELAPGTYTLLAGWYHYPDNTRFNVISDLPGQRDQDETVELGTVTIR